MSGDTGSTVRKTLPGSANFRRWLVWLGPLLVLGACAETKLAIHAAKQFVAPERSVAKTRGDYKVGRPYQVKDTWYYPAADYEYAETGIASWYGPNFHGKPTANGETFDMNALSAAHRTLPLPSLVRVVNLRNGRSIAVRVNDRGPFARGRIIDVSRRTAQLLGFERQGTTPVRVEIMAQESRQLALIAQRGSPAAVARAPARQSDAVTIEALPPPGETGGASAKNVQLAAARQPRRRNGEIVAPPAPRLEFRSVRPPRLFVQAGSFVRREYAERMRHKLSQIGPAHITEAVVGRYRFYRVRVGPLKSVREGDRVLDNVIAYGYPNARLIAD